MSNGTTFSFFSSLPYFVVVFIDAIFGSMDVGIIWFNVNNYINVNISFFFLFP